MTNAWFDVEWMDAKADQYRAKAQAEGGPAPPRELSRLSYTVGGFRILDT